MNDKLNMLIEDAGFTVRGENALKNMGCVTLGDVLKITEKELFFSSNFGKKSLALVKKVLREHGLIFPCQKINKYGWNHIETAPRDGTVILVRNKWFAACAKYVPDRPAGLDWQIDQTNEGIPFVTYWMPLLPLPKDNTK